MIGLIYEIATGLVEAELGGADITEETLPAEHGYSEEYGFLYGASWAPGTYVSDGSLVARPEMSVTQAGNTLTVPSGTEYFVRGPATAEGITEDGVLEFEFAEPGTYTVVLRLFPYLDAEVTLEG